MESFPNKLAFLHRVRKTPDVVREECNGSKRSKAELLLDFVTRTYAQLDKALELARDNSSETQTNMKAHYDRKPKVITLEQGEGVLALLPLQGKPLTVSLIESYIVKMKVGDLD